MAANLMERAEEFLRQDSFRRSAFLMIAEIVYLSPTPPSVLVDECLHSIFFFGSIHKPSYSPKEILKNDDMLRDLEKLYPQPFELCLTRLPKRSPFSCVLDIIMVVHQIRPEEERRVIESLQTFIQSLREQKATQLMSSTICVSQIKPVSNSVRYYGVSMSTPGRVHGQIMVAASCLSNWDSYVADAVMTYNLNRQKKTYFDGTLQLQELIRCEAFDLGNGGCKDPCRSCADLFGLTTGVQQRWAYGHCAEAESISNLLKREDEVRQEARPRSENYTDENRERAKNSVLTDLRRFLEDVSFKTRDPEFYTPQGI